MTNNTFEDYWTQNQDKYIQESKSKAKEDFTHLSSKFKASVGINDDGYFKLDIPHNFNLYSETQEQVVIDLIEKLNNAKIVYYNTNTARFGSGEEAIKSIKEHWLEMKDFIIQELEDGETYTFIETAEVDLMSVEISENN